MRDGRDRPAPPMTLVVAGKASANLLGTDRSSSAAWIGASTVPSMSCTLAKTGTSDPLGEMCPQALLRELPLDVLAEHRYVGQIRATAEIGPPFRRPDPHLMSFH